MNGSELIRDERVRQVDVECFKPEDDDKYVMGELASGAACYMAVAQAQVVAKATGEKTVPHPDILSLWPWDKAWWKPAPEPIRNFAKAGAMIAAELDRLRRLDPKPDEVFRLWEYFCDESYYQLWAVRRRTEREFGQCFHMHNQLEAQALTRLLNESRIP